MHTYTFAFYLSKNNHSEIFEQNQKDLEMSIEELSGYLERETSEQDLTVLKRQVLDKSKYCEQRLLVLEEHVKEVRWQAPL